MQEKDKTILKVYLIAPLFILCILAGTYIGESNVQVACDQKSEFAYHGDKYLCYKKYDIGNAK